MQTIRSGSSGSRFPAAGPDSMTRLDDLDARRYEAAVGRHRARRGAPLTAGVFANRSRATPSGIALAPWRVARDRYERAITEATSGSARAAFVGDVATVLPLDRRAYRRRRLCDGSGCPSRRPSGSPASSTSSRVGACLGCRSVRPPRPWSRTRSSRRSTASSPRRPGGPRCGGSTTSWSSRPTRRPPAGPRARSIARWGCSAWLAHPFKCRVVPDPARCDRSRARASALPVSDRGMMRAP